MTQQLETQVRHLAEIAVVDLIGDIDAFGEEALDAAYAAATAKDSVPVLLNFAGVGYINSTGIALIVGLLARGRKENRRLLTCGLTDHYREIFEITRLADFMTILPDEESAITEIAKGAPST